MQQCFKDVLAFHKKFNHVVQTLPNDVDDKTWGLRVKLIEEEWDELAWAMEQGDLPGIADGCADLIYVIIGTAISYGIDLRVVWPAVQNNNMSKIVGAKDADGKTIKSPDHQPPDFAAILKNQGPIL